MIEHAQGDILAADVEALVNTVNCVGFMGRGIALQFRKAFPENFKLYQAVCKRDELKIGKLLVFRTGLLGNPKFIINFPTKIHWKGKSKLSYVDEGLRALTTEVKRLNIRSIAIPPLGCGLGGLNWEDVRPKIERAFAALPGVQVLIFGPSGAPAAQKMARTAAVPRMTVGRAALLALMNRYLAALMDPFVTLLEIHKLMYFMQESGEPLRLTYMKAQYGPHAENLRHVLNVIEGHFIHGYADANDAPEKQIEVIADAASQAHAFLKDHPQVQQRFERVVNLVEGFETPFGMELLATVHWVVTREGANSAELAIEKTHAWIERKRIFEPLQIRRAFDTLKQKGWLTVAV